jgi:hypothetical protein
MSSAQGGLSGKPAFGCFVDRTQEPSRASVRTELGKACAPWDELEGHLAEAYGLTGSFHFMYGTRYGWALRFERGGRLVLAMYPNREHLTAQIILNRAQVAAATSMGLPPAIARVLRAAKDYPEGRWLFVPVASLKTVRELKALIALKLAARNRESRVSGSPRRRARGRRP